MKPRIRKCQLAPRVWECRIAWFTPVGHGYTAAEAFRDWEQQIKAAAERHRLVWQQVRYA